MGIIRQSVWVLGLVFALAACGIKVGLTNPTPNVDMDETGKTLSIALDPAVQDTFEVPASHGMGKTTVENWHGSLIAGLTNAFGPYFKIVPSGGDYTIRIKRADMEFAPAAVNVSGGAVAAVAQVTYQARLLDANGETLARSGDTVTAKKAITGRFEATNNAAEAIATMVEKMAADFFEKGLPGAKADEEKQDDGEKADEEGQDDGEKADEQKKDDEQKDDEAKDEEKKDEGDAK